MSSQRLIDFDQLESLLEKSISLFPAEGNAPIELKAHLLRLRLMEIKGICRELRLGKAN